MRVELETPKQLKSDVVRLRRGVTVDFYKWQNYVFERGKMRKKIEGLEDHTHRATIAQQRRLLELNRLAIQLHISGIRNFQPREYSQERCLTAARGPDQNQAMGIFECQGEIIERLVRAPKAFGQIGDFKFQIEAFFPTNASKAKSAGSE